MIKSELKCCGCNGEMSPPLKIFQCQMGHNQCQQCHMQIEEKVRGYICRIIEIMQASAGLPPVQCSGHREEHCGRKYFKYCVFEMHYFLLFKSTQYLIQINRFQELAMPSVFNVNSCLI